MAGFHQEIPLREAAIRLKEIKNRLRIRYGVSNWHAGTPTMSHATAGEQQRGDSHTM